MTSAPREVSEAEVRERLRTKWGVSATEQTLCYPWLYNGVLSTVGLRWSDGHYREVSG